MATDPTPPNWVPRSCSLAIQAPEILCKILLYLDPKDLLINAPRVCKFWKDAIERDPELQRALFFKPWQPEPSDSQAGGHRQPKDVLNPFFAEFLTPVPRHISRKDKINGSGYRGKADVVGLFENGPAKSGSWRRPEASWRRMLVQQPPRDLVVLQKRTCGQPYDELRYYTAKLFRGVLMSDLYHLLWAYIRVSMTEGLLEEVAAEFEESSSCRGILACATRWYLMTGVNDKCSEPMAPKKVELPVVEKLSVTRLQTRFMKGPEQPMVLTLMDRCKDCKGQCKFCGPWMARYGQRRSAEAAIRLGFDKSRKGVIEMWDDYALQHEAGAAGADDRKRDEKMALRKQGWQTVYKADYDENVFDYYNGALALVDLTR